MADVSYTALFVDASGRLPSPPSSGPSATRASRWRSSARSTPSAWRRAGTWFVPIGVGPASDWAYTCRSHASNSGRTSRWCSRARRRVGRSTRIPTGGYYQPVRLIASEGGGRSIAVGETRLSCGLAGATPDVLRGLSSRYHANVNPVVAVARRRRRRIVPDGRQRCGTNPVAARGAPHAEGRMGRLSDQGRLPRRRMRTRRERSRVARPTAPARTGRRSGARVPSDTLRFSSRRRRSPISASRSA